MLSVSFVFVEIQDIHIFDDDSMKYYWFKIINIVSGRIGVGG